jgi:hypothetical protein
MITNLQIRNIIGSEIKNCTDSELNVIRELLTTLATIEYEGYCKKKVDINAAETNKLRYISQQKREVAA